MRTRTQVANAAIYLSFSIAGSALGFGAVLVLTRLLLPAEYGRVGLFFSVLYFVAPLVSLSCDGLIAVNKSRLTPERYRQFQQTCVGVALSSCALCQAVMLALWAAHVLNDWLLMLAPLFAFVRMLTGMAGTEYVAEQRAMTYGALTLANAVVALGLTVAFAEIFGGSAGARVAAMLLADMALLAARYWGRLDVFLQPRLRGEFTAQLLRFGLPSVIAVAGGWGLNESDKVIVAAGRGMDAVGLYTAAAGLASIMLTFNQSVTNALYPGLFRALGDGTRQFRNVLLRYVFGFTSLSAIFAICMIAGYVFVAPYILPKRYLSAGSLFMAMMGAGVVVSFYRPFGLIADFRMLARTRAAAVLFGGAVTMTVTTLGIRHGTLLWAPAGIAAGYLAAVGVLLAGMKLTGADL